MLASKIVLLLIIEEELLLYAQLRRRKLLICLKSFQKNQPLDKNKQPTRCSAMVLFITRHIAFVSFVLENYFYDSWNSFIMTRIIVLFSSILVALVASQNSRTLLLIKQNDVRYQCTDSDCLSPTIFFSISLRRCETICLQNIDCRTLNYDPSTYQCKMYVDISSQFGSIIPQAGVVTLVAADDRQLSARKSF